MNELQIFESDEFGSVRTATIDGEPWFVGKDIARALEYSNASKAVITHVDNEDKRTEIRPNSQNGNTVGKITLINESGLYSLILSSKLPTAKKFKRWVTSEVLPAIRKTGKYRIEKIEPTRPITTDDYMKAANTVAHCENSRLPIVMDLYRKAGLDVPKIEATQIEASGTGGSSRGMPDYDLMELMSRFSLNDLSEKLDMSVSTVWRYQNGTRKPKPARREYIIQILEKCENGETTSDTGEESKE